MSVDLEILAIPCPNAGCDAAVDERCDWLDDDTSFCPERAEAARRARENGETDAFNAAIDAGIEAGKAARKESNA